MNEAWAEHIQPIINSSGFDHAQWIWDPFLKKYPEFKSEQRIQVEDTLLSYSFDSTAEDLTIKALGIAEALYNSKIASKRFSSKMKAGLRKHAQNIHMDQPALRYYIFAFATFGVKEAIPNIKLIMHRLQKGLPESPIYLEERSHQELFRACCLSLLKLGDSEAKSLLVAFIVNDIRLRAVSPARAMWGLADLAIFWDHIGVSGFKEIVESLQTWQNKYLVIVLPQLKHRIELMRFRSAREKQKVMTLVRDLENCVTRA